MEYFISLLKTAEAGLFCSAVIVFLALTHRVVFHWKKYKRVQLPRHCQKILDRWWRIAWGTLSMGSTHYFGAILLRVYDIVPGISLAYHIVMFLSLLLINIGGVMAKAGLMMNEGFDYRVSLPISMIPLGFISIAFWGH